jgi:diacylglycerol kinase family enzyme
VCEIHEGSIIKAIPLLLKAVNGHHVGAKKVSMSRESEIIFRSNRPAPIHADGEILTLMAEEVRFKHFPDALRVIIPTV